MEKRDALGRTEKEYLAAYRPERYPRPFLTADIVLLAKESNRLHVLLIRRRNHPFIECWALPGGFARSDESIEQTAARELSEETGISEIPFTSVGLFSKPGRDPRGWVVSQAYAAFVNRAELKVHAGDDAKDAKWFTVDNNGNCLVNGDIRLALSENEVSENCERLAFDHADIIKRAICLSTHMNK